MSLADDDPAPEETTPAEMLAATVCAYLGLHLSLAMIDAGHPLRELTMDVQVSVSPWPAYALEVLTVTVRARSEGANALQFPAIVQQVLARALRGAGLREDLETSLDAVLLV